MNAPQTLQHLKQIHHPLQQQAPREDEINLAESWDIIVDNRWLVAGVVAIAMALGASYAFLAKPVYESNLLIQVEDSATSAKSFLGEAASLFDVKTPATAEIEIIRSRMVIGQAVDATHLYIDAKPRLLPVIGSWLARRAKELSSPGILGFGGWVSGTEEIDVTSFEVPKHLEGSSFLLTAQAENKYTLSSPELDETYSGAVGAPLNVSLRGGGALSLLVANMQAKPGGQFTLTRLSRLETIEELQENLKLTERGRQSGVIDATLQEKDRVKLTLILNEIGKQYVRQNVERKAAEAQKTLSFLDIQIPQFKKQLDLAEEAYNKYRNQKGTVALDEEAKVVLGTNVDLQTKLLEAQQRRVELISRFTAEHPAVRTLDAQIANWASQISALNARIKGMPSIQQDTIRLERDVKVNNELYQQLRNNVLQLQLIREGKIGNVRLIDQAVAPEEPVRPKKAIALGLSLVLGLFFGCAIVLARNTFFRGIKNTQEIENHTGLNVFSTIPLSEAQKAMARDVASKAPGIHILEQTEPHDVAIESLRSLRTALQFAMLEAHNNRVLISGATPGVGKSFVSANFAAVLASAGKRVLLIDADLRKGHLNQYFGLTRSGGLSELIAGTTTLESALHRNVLSNLDLITTGALPPNPAELMVSGAFTQLLDKLSPDYDLVLIDSAPVLVAADTVSISVQVGTILLVARAEQTQVGELNESARRLSHAGKSVSGVLFNAVDLTRRHYGSYSYKYGEYRYRNYSYAPQTGIEQS